MAAQIVHPRPKVPENSAQSAETKEVGDSFVVNLGSPNSQDYQGRGLPHPETGHRTGRVG